MRHLCWLTVVLLAGVARGEEAPFPKTEQGERDLAELDRMPVAVECRDISKAINAIQQEQQKRSAELYERLQKLQQSDAYREYRNRRQEIESQRSTAWDVERKAMAEAARKIYAARHEEIKERAKAECPHARTSGLDMMTYPRVDGSEL